MQRVGQSLIPHGTLASYDPTTGAFVAFMDFQPAGEAAYSFTPLDAGKDLFQDQNGLTWALVR